jgi:hypothetical protein
VTVKRPARKEGVARQIKNYVKQIDDGGCEGQKNDNKDVVVPQQQPASLTMPSSAESCSPFLDSPEEIIDHIVVKVSAWSSQ